MTAATVTSKGQLTIPKDVREALGIGPGDRVEFVQMADGSFAIKPATKPLMRLKGSIRKPLSPVSLADMDDAVAEGAAGE